MFLYSIKLYGTFSNCYTGGRDNTCMIIIFTPVYFLMSQFPTPTLQKVVLCHLDKIGIKDKLKEQIKFCSVSESFINSLIAFILNIPLFFFLCLIPKYCKIMRCWNVIANRFRNSFQFYVVEHFFK